MLPPIQDAPPDAPIPKFPVGDGHDSKPEQVQLSGHERATLSDSEVCLGDTEIGTPWVQGEPMAQSDAQRIAVGQTAWRELSKQRRLEWGLWSQVIVSLGIGRRRVLQQIARDKGVPLQDVQPKGKRYTLAFSQWLKSNEFADMPKSSRKGCLDCFPHLPQITRALEALQEEDRDRWQRMTHPATVWAWFNKTLEDGDDKGKPKRPNPLFGKSDEGVAAEIGKTIAARRTHNIARHGGRDIDAEIIEAATRAKDGEEFEAAERKKVGDPQARVQELEWQIAEGGIDAGSIEARQDARRLQAQLGAQNQELESARNRVAELQKIIDGARSPDVLVQQKIRDLSAMVAFQREQSARRDAELGERLRQLEAERDDLRQQLETALALPRSAESDVR